ncbi:MAG: histidine phosphatase family protein [Patescibacteria group bacterium]
MAKIIKQCTIYLVRHGETDNNKQGIIQGSTIDAPLNSTGVKQARAAAKKLKTIPFAAAFSSQAVRANQTAKIIGLQHQLAVTAHHILRERGFGELEGQPETVYHAKLKQLLADYEKLSTEEKFEFQFPYGIENLGAAVTRLITFLREISFAYSSQTVLVVSHGALMRNFLIRIGWADFQQLRWHPGGQPPISNLGFAVIESDGIDFKITNTFGINVRR